MRDGDFFDVPEIDVFRSEVEALVISVYTATIAGIDRMDKQKRARLKMYDRDSHPEIDQEIDWWNREVSAMKRHAGNMALVSLYSLFADWVERHGGFQELPGAKLTFARRKEISVARNSVIHHRGKAKFQYRAVTTFDVSNEFLVFDDTSGEERVAIEEAVLLSVADEMTSYVDLRKREETVRTTKSRTQRSQTD